MWSNASRLTAAGLSNTSPSSALNDARKLRRVDEEERLGRVVLSERLLPVLLHDFGALEAFVEAPIRSSTWSGPNCAALL